MTSVIAALITAISGILVAGATYWFTKQRERNAEWRKEKLDHYKAFANALSGILEGETTPEGRISFARACNNLNLIAPHDVIEKLRAYSDEISIKNTNKNRDKHDKLLSELFLSIRRDLDISPPDDREAFSVKLWASGVKTDR